MQVSASIIFCTNVYLLSTAECYKSVILYLIQSSCTVVLRMLAEDLCSNENGVVFLDHNTNYNETIKTTASSRHELTRDVQKCWKLIAHKNKDTLHTTT